MKKIHFLYILISFLVITIIIIILTQTIFFSGISLNSTGQIGDTIGGISSPIVGILGAYLVWVTFDQQNSYNKEQDNRLHGERWYSDHIDFLKEIKKDYDELTLEVELKDPIVDIKKIVSLRRTRLLTPLEGYLKNYNSIPQIFKYEADNYVYDFGFILIRLNNLISIAISKSQIYKQESADLLYQCSLFHDMYTKYTTTKLLENLNESNDKKNSRQKIKETFDFIEKNIPSPIPNKNH